MMYRKGSLIILRSIFLLSHILPCALSKVENIHHHHSPRSRENSSDYHQTQNSRTSTGASDSAVNATRLSTFHLMFPSAAINRLAPNIRGVEENALATATNTVIKKPAEGCHGCPKLQQVESLPKDILRLMRLKHAKDQILKKLNMKEPPPVRSSTAKNVLPSALTKQLVGSPHHEEKHDSEDDEQTEEVIVYLEEARSNCVQNETDPHTCFGFQIPKEMDHKKVSRAELWIYKKAHSERRNSFWVAEFTARKPHAKQNVTIREGWVKLDISSLITNWHGKHLRTKPNFHKLHVGCATCTRNTASDFPFDVQTEENRPFAVIYTFAESFRKRNRRNTNCTPGFSECCRESFTVDFKEIGWESWILWPDSYQAYYCKGNCVNINAISLSNSHHTSIMQRYIQVWGINSTTEELVPCCTASQRSSISLLYRNHDNTTIHRTLHNMVVDSCGCR